MENTFLITKPIDYKTQREKFLSYLQQKGKQENEIKQALEIYDTLLNHVGNLNETFLSYDMFHVQLKKLCDDLRLRMRLYIKDDGDNALFIFKSVHDDFTLRFYTEFKSIYGDVEKMRIAKMQRIAKKIAGLEE